MLIWEIMNNDETWKHLTNPKEDGQFLVDFILCYAYWSTFWRAEWGRWWWGGGTIRKIKKGSKRRSTKRYRTPHGLKKKKKTARGGGAAHTHIIPHKHWKQAGCQLMSLHITVTVKTVIIWQLCEQLTCNKSPHVGLVWTHNLATDVSVNTTYKTIIRGWI